ncbi:MAG: hypothetical protein KJ749_08105, partial [Planctomycetes bacterium]|nr:hypothetical protein [Planctomycetota bacterium]
MLSDRPRKPFESASRADRKAVPAATRQPRQPPPYGVHSPYSARWPPDGAIDARQPHALDDPDERYGWDQITLVFYEPMPAMAAGHFTITESGGDGVPPTIEEVVAPEPTSIRLTLSEPIEPRAWTMIRHKLSGSTMCLGYLPGDVNGDTFTASSDITPLIDSLNAVPGRVRP